MSSKVVESRQDNCQRITRSNKNPKIIEVEISKAKVKGSLTDLGIGDIPIPQNKQQQTKEKNQKQTASQPNNEVLNPSNCNIASKRLTRSSLQTLKGNDCDGDGALQQVTPEDNVISKGSEEPTTKKMVKYHSSQELKESLNPDLVLTGRKSNNKYNDVVSPYGEFRKSYRKKLSRRGVATIPYRKCHDLLEGRVVTVINKIQTGKNCVRDIDSLVQKMQKISIKDMLNRYVIAGIKTIVKIAKQSSPTDIKIIEKMEGQQKKMMIRITEELDRIDQFEDSTPVAVNQLQADSYKHLVMRRMYKLLKQQSPSTNKQTVRARTIQLCQQMFKSQVTAGKILQSFRSIQNLPDQ